MFASFFSRKSNKYREFITAAPFLIFYCPSFISTLTLPELYQMSTTPRLLIITNIYRVAGALRLWRTNLPYILSSHIINNFTCVNNISLRLKKDITTHQHF